MPQHLIIPREFEGNNVGIIDQDGDHWFVLADVCRVLGINNPSQVASRLDPEEKDTLTNNEGIADARVQTFTIISLSALGKLLSRSHKPVAKRFSKWFFGDVLPS